MVYCVLVRLLQRAYAVCTIQLAIYALCVSFKIWPTNESLSFSENQHSGVEKQFVALQKMIEKKKRRVKWTEANCVFCFFYHSLVYFIFLFYIIFLFTLIFLS